MTARAADAALMVVRFGIVGLTAAGVHSALLLFLVSKLGFSGAGATPIAFACAFVVSYLGQSRWTFGADHNRAQLVRYGFTALVGLGLNTLSAWLVIDILHRPPVFVLPFIILGVPLVTFSLMRFWVFPSKASPAPSAFPLPESRDS